MKENKQIEPTLENSRLLAEYIKIRISKALRERFPTAEDIVGEIEK